MLNIVGNFGKMLMYKMYKKRDGLAQIPLIIGLIVIAIALPLATKLVQQNTENRGRAASCADLNAAACAKDSRCYWSGLSGPSRGQLPDTCENKIPVGGYCNSALFGNSQCTSGVCKLNYCVNSTNDCVHQDAAKVISNGGKLCWDWDIHTCVNGKIDEAGVVRCTAFAVNNPDRVGCSGSQKGLCTFSDALKTVACTSYTTGSWGTCTNGTQTRTVTGVPAGCSGGVTKPATSQSCSSGGTTSVCSGSCTASSSSGPTYKCINNNSTSCICPPISSSTWQKNADCGTNGCDSSTGKCKTSGGTTDDKKCSSVANSVCVANNKCPAGAGFAQPSGGFTDCTGSNVCCDKTEIAKAGTCYDTGVCIAAGGHCGNPSGWSGTTKTGLCPGSTSCVCLIPGSGGGTTNTCTSQGSNYSCWGSGNKDCATVESIKNDGYDYVAASGNCDTATNKGTFCCLKKTKTASTCTTSGGTCYITQINGKIPNTCLDYTIAYKKLYAGASGTCTTGICCKAPVDCTCPSGYSISTTSCSSGMTLDTKDSTNCGSAVKCGKCIAGATTCTNGQQKCVTGNKYVTCANGQWGTTQTACASGKTCASGQVGTGVCITTGGVPSVSLTSPANNVSVAQGTSLQVSGTCTNCHHAALLLDNAFVSGSYVSTTNGTYSFTYNLSSSLAATAHTLTLKGCSVDSSTTGDDCPAGNFATSNVTINVTTADSCYTCPNGQKRAKGVADANCDGSVNETDFAVWLSEYQKGTKNKADFDCDGSAGITDFSKWNNSFQK